MQSYQWFLLGMMVAWTPALIVLAVILECDFRDSKRSETEFHHQLTGKNYPGS
jgi:hypothetical protein